MNERLTLLFKFREDCERILEQEWTEPTRKEIEKRLEKIVNELYAQSEDGQRVSENLDKNIRQSIENERLWTG